ncbi:MAG: hypothetical protein QOF58_4715, partial [Pseudonocardiales bacterium]|nr:hypothetical protein [Pseudonocardiales bacterium]
MLENEFPISAPIADLELDGTGPGGVRLLVSTKDFAVVVDPETGQRSEPLMPPPEWFRLYGRRLAIEDTIFEIDGSDIRVLRPSSKRVVNWSGHTTPISMLMAVPGPMLVSSSRGGSIRFWNAETGEQVRIAFPVDETTALAWYIATDRRLRIVSGGSAGVLHIWDPQLPAPAPRQRTEQVQIRGFSDRAAEVDLLNRQAFINTIAEALKPDPKDEGPTVLTVEGPWGSGKSSLMELVKKELPMPEPAGASTGPLTVAEADRLLRVDRRQASTEDLKPQTAVVAGFNPWRHQSSEQVWAGLARAITDTAMKAMYGENRAARERHWFTRNVDRIDRRHVLRELRKRILSPFLALGVLGFGVSLLAAVSKLTAPSWWLIAIPAAPLVFGIGQTLWRYYRTPASRYLPGELFAGPTLSEPTDPAVRDPYYRARSGYLYLVQHDIAELLTDLARLDLQLVVMIDDLDRCTPRTTAEVFEAINVFLSDTFRRTRFVLGLDPIVVASHIDHAYKELADAKVVTHPDDPSPGWTFLRKLVQLPVRVPRTTSDNIDSILEDQLGPTHRDETPADESEPSLPTAAPDPT